MKEIILKNIDEVIYFDKTDEGLDIYLCVNKKVNNFYATYNIKYGSVDTEFKVGKKKINVPDGTAHFLEHIKFNIDKDKSATDFFQHYGLNVNAFTTFNYTAYEVMGDNYFKEGLEYLMEYISIPYFTKETVENEKGIISEEASMVFDNPYNTLFYETFKSVFHFNKRRNLITGTKEDVNRITLQNITDVYNNFYHPKNSFIVITGNFNPYEALSIIKKKLKKINYGEYSNPVKIYKDEPLEVFEKLKVIKDKVKLDKGQLYYKFDINRFKKLDKEKLSLIVKVIIRHNFSTTSDFREDLFDKELVTSFSVNHSLIDDHYVIGFSIESNYLDDVIDLVHQKMNNLDMNMKTIKRRARVNIAGLINSFDDIELINNSIQSSIVNFNSINDNYYDLYNSVTMDDVNYIFKNLDVNNYSIIKMEPDGDV